MQVSWVLKFTVPILLLALSQTVSLSQEPECVQISLRAQMARARSPETLEALQKKADGSYRNTLAFAARELELEPASKAAADRLLDMLPNEGDPNTEAWGDLLGLQACERGGLPKGDLEALGRLEYHLPRLAARAALVSPQRLPALLAHTQLFITPESDFTIHLQLVCRKQHKAFLDAVDRLPANDKHWFISTIFNPAPCRAIFLPEQ